MPITRRLAVNVAVEKMRAERFNPVTRIFVSPAVVWRWGSERVYGFAGGGVGVQTDRSVGILFVPGQQPSGRPVQSTEHGMTFHGQVGIVFNPVGGLIVRTELVSHWRYVLPTTGLRIGIGYRF